MPGAGLEPAWGRPRGIFLPATAFTAARLASPKLHARRAFGVWTLPLPCRRARRAERGRFRQGPSSLYTFPGRAGPRADTGGRGLARRCRHCRCGCSTEFDPIHSRGFPPGCSKCFKSLASTDFATRATGAPPILSHGACQRRSLASPLIAWRQPPEFATITNLSRDLSALSALQGAARMPGVHVRAVVALRESPSVAG